MEVDNDKKIMNEGEIQHIKQHVKHRFTGLKDSKIIEFSTHHKESDSYRGELSGKVNLNKMEIIK